MRKAYSLAAVVAMAFMQGCAPGPGGPPDAEPAAREAAAPGAELAFTVAGMT